jgi:hypothetical protein
MFSSSPHLLVCPGMCEIVNIDCGVLFDHEIIADKPCSGHVALGWGLLRSNAGKGEDRRSLVVIFTGSQGSFHFKLFLNTKGPVGRGLDARYIEYTNASIHNLCSRQMSRLLCRYFTSIVSVPQLIRSSTCHTCSVPTQNTG